MAMVQGIDGGLLLNAFRQGRSDRQDAEAFRAKQEAAMEERRRDAEFRSLAAQAIGGTAPTVAAMATQPAAEAPPGFAQAFAPGFEAQAGPTPIAAPMAAPAVRQPDPDVLRRLVILDSKRAEPIVSAFKSMSETQIKQIEARNNHMGAAARYVQQGRTPAERYERFQIATPSLLEAGYTPEELDGIDNDLSDTRLQFYQATAIDYDKLIDNELAEREFQAGKIVTPTLGAGAFRARPDGTMETLVAPNDGSQPTGSPVAIAPVQKKNVGGKTYFQTPDGKWHDEPVGGGASNGTGGFQP